MNKPSKSRELQDDKMKMLFDLEPKRYKDFVVPLWTEKRFFAMEPDRAIVWAHRILAMAHDIKRDVALREIPEAERPVEGMLPYPSE